MTLHYLMKCRQCIIKPTCSKFCFDKCSEEYMDWFVENKVCPHCGYYEFYISRHDTLPHTFVCTQCNTHYMSVYRGRNHGMDSKLVLIPTNKYVDLTIIPFYDYIMTRPGHEIVWFIEKRRLHGEE